MSNPMSNIAAEAAKKQAQIDSVFLADVQRIRIAYLAKLKDGAAAAEQSGQLDLANSVRASSTLAIDYEQWISGFGIDPKPAGKTWQPHQKPKGKAPGGTRK